MEKFLREHLGTVFTSLIVAGILSFTSVTYQINSDNNLTREKLSQIDSMMMDFKNEMKDMRRSIEGFSYSRWTREDQKSYQEANTELLRAMSKSIEASTAAIAVIQSKLESMERRIQTLESKK